VLRLVAVFFGGWVGLLAAWQDVLSQPVQTCAQEAACRLVNSLLCSSGLMPLVLLLLLWGSVGCGHGCSEVDASELLTGEVGMGSQAKSVGCCVAGRSSAFVDAFDVH
jgi:hypothetical protein